MAATSRYATVGRLAVPISSRHRGTCGADDHVCQSAGSSDDDRSWSSCCLRRSDLVILRVARSSEEPLGHTAAEPARAVFALVDARRSASRPFRSTSAGQHWLDRTDLEATARRRYNTLIGSTSTIVHRRTSGRGRARRAAPAASTRGECPSGRTARGARPSAGSSGAGAGPRTRIRRLSDSRAAR